MPIHGDVGVKETIEELKQTYIQNNMSKMVKKFICKCDARKQTESMKEHLIDTGNRSTSLETIPTDTDNSIGRLRLLKFYRCKVQLKLRKWLTIGLGCAYSKLWENWKVVCKVFCKKM